MLEIKEQKIDKAQFEEAAYILKTCVQKVS